jgi:HSP20 family protein
MATEQELQVQQKREVDKKQESTISMRQFLPITDIFETDQALTLMVEMPGVKKENVDIQVENDVLTIQGRIDFANYEGLQPLLPNTMSATTPAVSSSQARSIRQKSKRSSRTE